MNVLIIATPQFMSCSEAGTCVFTSASLTLNAWHVFLEGSKGSGHLFEVIPHSSPARSIPDLREMRRWDTEKVRGLGGLHSTAEVEREPAGCVEGLQTAKSPAAHTPTSGRRRLVKC